MFYALSIPCLGFIRCIARKNSTAVLGERPLWSVEFKGSNGKYGLSTVMMAAKFMLDFMSVVRTATAFSNRNYNLDCYSTLHALLSEEPMPLPCDLLLLIDGGMVTCMPCAGGTSFGGVFAFGV